MDADYGRNLDEAGEESAEFEHALFVAATVMSASAPGRAVVDAGHKASAIDSGLPKVWRRADTTFVGASRSEEHTSELQSLMRISYAVFCLKKKKTKLTYITTNYTHNRPSQRAH